MRSLTGAKRNKTWRYIVVVGGGVRWMNVHEQLIITQLRPK
jgi:hypothetical protein